MDAVDRFRGSEEPPEWEYVPEGWSRRNTERVRGWGARTVIQRSQETWPAFVRSLEGPGPLTLEGRSSDAPWMHDIIVSYGYVVARAARAAATISMLDWGGGSGRYYLIARALVPDVEIDYHCKDLPDVCAYGRQLLPQAYFYDDESCFDRDYDLVMASGSLQFAEDWPTTLSHLARATRGYLYITRLPIVSDVHSFVIIQRPYRHGYDTEFLGWCVNRNELLERASDAGMVLVREFPGMEQCLVRGAPEQPRYRGFLFQPRASRSQRPFGD